MFLGDRALWVVVTCASGLKGFSGFLRCGYAFGTPRHALIEGDAFQNYSLKADFLYVQVLNSLIHFQCEAFIQGMLGFRVSNSSLTVTDGNGLIGI